MAGPVPASGKLSGCRDFDGGAKPVVLSEDEDRWRRMLPSDLEVVSGTPVVPINDAVQTHT